MLKEAGLIDEKWDLEYKIVLFLRQLEDLDTMRCQWEKYYSIFCLLPEVDCCFKNNYQEIMLGYFQTVIKMVVTHSLAGLSIRPAKYDCYR